MTNFQLPISNGSLAIGSKGHLKIGSWKLVIGSSYWTAYFLVDDPEEIKAVSGGGRTGLGTIF
jgi:hypothetical protein